jgi:hypothetical protein
LTADPQGTIPNQVMKNPALIAGLMLLGALALGSPARGQMRGGIGFASHGRTGPVAWRGGLAGSGLVQAHHFGRGRGYFAEPGYWPYFYPDSDSETIEAPPPETTPSPQVIVVPGTQAAAPARAAGPAESLVLELRDNHWVRISKYGQVTPLEARPAAGVASSGPTGVSAQGTDANASVSELPRAALVFRDGHTEEIRKYVIVGATLYTTSDFWSTGSWTRKIPIADLDVAATLKRNQERGAKFTLPSRPSEVILRP